MNHLSLAEPIQLANFTLMAYNKQTLTKIQHNATIYAIFNDDLTNTYYNCRHGLVL